MRTGFLVSQFKSLSNGETRSPKPLLFLSPSFPYPSSHFYHKERGETYKVRLSLSIQSISTPGGSRPQRKGRRVDPELLLSETTPGYGGNSYQVSHHVTPIYLSPRSHVGLDGNPQSLRVPRTTPSHSPRISLLTHSDPSVHLLPRLWTPSVTGCFRFPST